MIREFGEDSYFLTSLGAIFEKDSGAIMANMQYLLRTAPIGEVCILQSTDCTFINQNFNVGEKKIGLPTEQSFSSDYRAIVQKPVVSISISERKLELAEMNLRKQIMFASKIVEDFNNTTQQCALTGVIYGDGENFIERQIIRRIEDIELN